MVLERFCPDYYYGSILEIDLDELKRAGIKALVVDLDNTMVERGSSEAPESLQRWLKKVTGRGLKVCIVSNNWASRVSVIARKVKLPLVAPAGKPRGKAFKQGMKMIGSKPEETAVVGDQLFTDVLGGNLAGLRTVLVVPLKGPELPHTRLLRRLEKIILRKLDERGLIRRGS